MTSNTKSSHFLKNLLRMIPYLVVVAGIITLAFWGSRDKTITTSESLSMQSIASDNFNITADQLSEFYVVANLATYMNLSNTDALSSNYVAMTVMSRVGQSDATKIEKPSIVDTSHIPRGIIEYVVQDGDTLDSIASSHGLAADQVRWSNNLSNSSISIGQVLYLPNVPGIIYTVQEGDTVESLAAKYGSSARDISDLLEDNELRVGAMIVLPNGILPENERPEYTAPVIAYSTPTYAYSYTYFGSSWDRRNMRTVGTCPECYAGNPYIAGQCTWYAWAMRRDLPSQLGNAYSWAANASAAGYLVDRTPAAGAIFQTGSGWGYGHVGYVVGVNSDGSITVREMNYNYQAYIISESEIPANQVGNYLYIH